MGRKELIQMCEWSVLQGHVSVRPNKRTETQSGPLVVADRSRSSWAYLHV